MAIHKRLFSITVLAALVLLGSGCETTNSRRDAAAPPSGAQAPVLTAATAASPNTTPSTKPAPRTPEPSAKRVDPVESLLARIRKEYQDGQAEYAAGHLDAARAHFDRAFDLLLTGPINARSDRRLEEEFERIVDGVNRLELEALKQGDGFTEQGPEPAPIDEASAVTFPVDPNLRARAEAGLRTTTSDIPLVMNDVVASYLEYFSNTNKGRNTMQHSWERAARYRDTILRILREEGVPQDLIYLAQAESGFHPLAVSRAGARGMWQFMAARASEYGLQRNWWIDERQDPEKATRAAARHLRDLYEQFGDWHLAIAAYNSGPLNVQKGVERTGYADFWELYKRDVLPSETKNYVPIILAVMIIAKNPGAYGFQPMEAQPVAVERVTVDYPLDLRLAAEAIDVPVSILQDLNPGLLRMTTPREGTFDLRLPWGTKETFERAVAAIPRDMRVWWRYHRVASGETLSTIARKYRTTTDSIAKVNNLTGDALYADAKLIIPVTPGKRLPGDMEGMVFSKQPVRYKVRQGDTLMSIADDFGVPLEKLRQWNRLRGNHVRRGQLLRIYRPVMVEYREAAASTPKSKTNKQLSGKAGEQVHTVRSGETLYSIASAYGTTVAELQRANGLTSSRLYPGDTLIVRSGP
jgi:membrane-bound lytic murein transglycosylase D